MTQELYLDPARVNTLLPSEGVPGNRWRISPFAIPRSAVCTVDSAGRLTRTRFEYPGDQHEGWSRTHRLRSSGAIHVSVSPATDAIIEISFVPPVGQSGLRAIAGEMKDTTGSLMSVSERFSYRIISEILCVWADSLTSAP
jgi:hypothetical protein